MKFSLRNSQTLEELSVMKIGCKSNLTSLERSNRFLQCQDIDF